MIELAFELGLDDELHVVLGVGSRQLAANLRGQRGKIDVLRSHLAPGETGQRKQGVDQLRHLLCVRVDLAETVESVGPQLVAVVLEQDRREAIHPAKRRAKIVGHGVTERCELGIGGFQPRVEPLQLRFAAQLRFRRPARRDDVRAGLHHRLEVLDRRFGVATGCVRQTEDADELDAREQRQAEKVIEGRMTGWESSAPGVSRRVVRDHRGTCGHHGTEQRGELAKPQLAAQELRVELAGLFAPGALGDRSCGQEWRAIRLVPQLVDEPVLAAGQLEKPLEQAIEGLERVRCGDVLRLG